MKKHEILSPQTRALLFDPVFPPSGRDRASGLNLAVASAILWNTVYLGRAVAELRSSGEAIPDDLLAHIAPLGWEHIRFNGDYVWPTEPLKDGFRPLRSTRSSILDAA